MEGERSVSTTKEKKSKMRTEVVDITCQTLRSHAYDAQTRWGDHDNNGLAIYLTVVMTSRVPDPGAFILYVVKFLLSGSVWCIDIHSGALCRFA